MDVKKTKKLKVKNGEVVEFLNISQLAKMCNRSTRAIKDMIINNLMPDANFRMPHAYPERGYRIYSVETAERIAKALAESGLKGGTFPAEKKQALKITLRKIFDEERLKYS
jgi:hypothetical protein